MTAPTNIAVYKDAYTGISTTTRVLTQISVATSDVCAVVGQTEDYGVLHVSALAKSAGTATISAPANPREAGAASHCANGLFTFTVTAGGTLTLTATLSAASGTRYTTFWTFVVTGSTGVGNTNLAAASDGSSQCTASIATSQDSAVLAVASDWDAKGSATTTLTPAGYASPVDAHETDGVVDQAGNGSRYSSRGGHWASVNSSAGTAYGVTAPGSSSYNIVVCEILGTAGDPPKSVSPAVAAAAGTAPAPTAEGRVTTAALYAGSATAITGSWAGTSNATGSTQGTYATWSDSGAGSAAVLELAAFAAQAAVPAGSTVNSVSCTIRHGETPAAQIASVTAQAYPGGSPSGSPQALTASDAVHDDTVTFTGLTWADLADLRVRLTVTRA